MPKLYPGLSRRAVLLALLLPAIGTALAFPPPALAAKAQIYTGLLSGTAVGGYDPVAYFTEGKPVAGSAQFTHSWQGVTWRFASAANRDAFKAAPERYAPQYGGYCAWAVSQGYTAKGDPQIWKVVGGKLYLNYSAGVQQQWSQDIPGNIAKANANWPKVLN
ncbi:MAG: YHS domain-containing protein [Rhodobiaceae bacterium]|nr:YHS domain-containing protein [Rhodobiaceae bacterium]